MLCSLLLALVAMAAPSAVAASTSCCGIRLGFTRKGIQGTNVTSMTEVRPGRHHCFDPLVLDHRGRAEGFAVR